MRRTRTGLVYLHKSKKKINGVKVCYFNQYNAVSGMDCFFFFFFANTMLCQRYFFLFFLMVFFIYLLIHFFFEIFGYLGGWFFWVVLTIDPILMFGCTKKKK